MGRYSKYNTKKEKTGCKKYRATGRYVFKNRNIPIKNLEDYIHNITAVSRQSDYWFGGFLFCFLAIPCGRQDLSSRLGIEPEPSAVKQGVLTTAPPMKSLQVVRLMIFFFFCLFAHPRVYNFSTINKYHLHNRKESFKKSKLNSVGK